MAFIEIDKMLRLACPTKRANDTVTREHQLSCAVISLSGDKEIEAIGKFDDMGNYIGYIVAFVDHRGEKTFYIKTNTEKVHSVEAKDCVIIECKGFFLEKEYIENIKYNVLSYACSEEADEEIYNHSMMIGMMMRNEGYTYYAEEQKFNRSQR